MSTKPSHERPLAEGGASIRLGRLDEFLGFRLRRVQNQLSKDFAGAIARHNMRSGLFSSLAIIAANPGISQNELSREVGLDKSVTVLIVDDLERAGHAVRERSKTDRRRHSLFITEAGEKHLDMLFGILERTEEVVAARLSQAEQNLLHELLDRVYAHWADEPRNGTD